jgi:two-component system response regulator FixJ
MSETGPICVVDDDSAVRDALKILLRMSGYRVEVYESAIAFLKDADIPNAACLIADIRMPDMDGLELQQTLVRRGIDIPVIVMTGHGDVPLAVKAMKVGAIDFLEKPFEEADLLASIKVALAKRASAPAKSAEGEKIRARIAELTPREKEVLDQLVEGHQNKMIAHNLDISPRTVEVYRGRVMDKLKARSIAELVRLALSARD